MKTAQDWKDYEVISSGNGEKKERWGDIILVRPDPQIIWKNKISYNDAHARYERSSSGGGSWQKFRTFPAEWKISWKNLKFIVKPMGFKHTGIFPEQAVNWKMMMDRIASARRKINVLNLFAYTGAATVACASVGANVVHVDSAKNMVERAKQNASLSGVGGASIRYIVDDCRKFIEREIRRGNKYDAIIMDPPSYGRGANGEVWKLEDDLFDFVALCKKIISDKPLFFLINSYTTGLGATAMENVLRMNFLGTRGSFESYEVGLESRDGIAIPCGCSAVLFGE